MKKILLIQILSFLIVGTAYAQTTTVLDVSGERQQTGNAKQEIEQVKQEAENAIKNAREFASSTHSSANGLRGKRAEIKMAVQELVEQKIENRINQIKESALKDFDITIKNLDNLNLRINSRIDKLEASSTFPLTEPRNLLKTASSSIELVRTAVENFRMTDFSTSTTSIEGSSSATEKILTQQEKDSIKEIKSLIGNARSALVDVVISLTVKQTENATTTE